MDYFNDFSLESYLNSPASGTSIDASPSRTDDMDDYASESEQHSPVASNNSKSSNNNESPPPPVMSEAITATANARQENAVDTMEFDRRSSESGSHASVQIQIKNPEVASSENSREKRQENLQLQQQSALISRLINGGNQEPPSPGNISLHAGSDFAQEESNSALNQGTRVLNSSRKTQPQGDSFESVFKKPLCLSFTEEDFSSPYARESEGEKLLSLGLLKEVGIDPKAKKQKEQYQRFALKDGDVKTFVDKTFRHKLIKEHYQALAKTVPKPDMHSMDWAKLDPTFQAELSYADGKPKPALQRLNEECALVKEHMRNYTDAAGPLVALLHFWEGGRSPDPSQVVTAIKQSLLFIGNATAQINHWRRKRVLEELGLHASLKSALDAAPEEGEELFGKAFMRKMVDENQKQKAAHKQVFEFKRRASGHFDTEDFYDKVSHSSRKRRADQHGPSEPKTKRQTTTSNSGKEDQQFFRSTAPERHNRPNWSRGQTSHNRGRGRRNNNAGNPQGTNNQKKVLFL